MSRMVEIPFVDIIGSIYWDQHHGAISFNVRGIHPHDVASIMDMDGVCIRAGHHCAQPLLTWLGVENLACCRMSVAFYNDQNDIDQFIEALYRVWHTFHPWGRSARAGQPPQPSRPPGTRRTRNPHPRRSRARKRAHRKGNHHGQPLQLRELHGAQLPPRLQVRDGRTHHTHDGINPAAAMSSRSRCASRAT